MKKYITKEHKSKKSCVYNSYRGEFSTFSNLSFFLASSRLRGVGSSVLSSSGSSGIFLPQKINIDLK